MNSMEIWRAVPGYEGLYEVSDLGRVRSMPWLVTDRLGRSRRKPGCVLKFAHDQGYPQVTLSGPNRCVEKVHRLVLKAFVGPRPPNMVSRHLNGNPADCRLVNLAYGTAQENMRDRVRHGTDPNARKTRCIWDHPLSGDNVCVTPSGARNCRACARAKYHRLKAKRALVGSTP